MPWSRGQSLSRFSGSFLLLLSQELHSPLCDISSDPFLILQHNTQVVSFHLECSISDFFSSQTCSSYLTLWPFPIRTWLRHSLSQQNFSEMLSSLSASTSSSPLFSHIPFKKLSHWEEEEKMLFLSRAAHPVATPYWTSQYLWQSSWP